MKNQEKAFSLKHIIGLIFVIIISALIIFYAEYLNRFSNYGYTGAFFAMFVSYASVILPTPGLAFIFALGKTLPNPLLVGILGGAGGALGEAIGYIAGSAGSGVVKKAPFHDRIDNIVNKYGIVAIFFLSVIPNPLFDLAGLSAGALGIKWWKFLIAVYLGTTVKAIVVAYMGALS